MKKAKVLTTAQFEKLVKDLSKLLNEGKKGSKQSANQARIQMYWSIGQRIVQENLTGKANYGKSILKDLSRQLSTDVRTLQYSTAFHDEYKTIPGDRNLTWSHYRLLLGVANPKARQWYQSAADKEELTRDELHNLIQEDVFNKHNKLRGVSKKKIKRPTEPSFLYKAQVERVIDGDTMVLQIDMGFETNKYQSIRLAQIDCPEIDTEEGKEAMRFVRDLMARLEYVMVKTNKTDVHGRFVGHIFYSFGLKNRDDVFSKGIYLNQELLDLGFAKTLLM